MYKAGMNSAAVKMQNLPSSLSFASTLPSLSPRAVVKILKDRWFLFFCCLFVFNR